MSMFRREVSNARWVQAASLGAVAGLRSMMSPALVARRLADDPPPAGRANVVARILARPAVAGGLGVAAALEVAADKLPFMPARTAPLLLLGRAVWGAVASVAWMGGRRSRDVAGAALLGAAAAVAASYGAYHLRALATRGRGRVATALAGLAEDLLAAGLVRVAQGKA